jgi:uncharacterized protein (DUF488 family)
VRRDPAWIDGMVPRLWSVGHSTRALDEFLGLLGAHDIEVVADVRRYPGSRRWPHFAREPLAESLAARGLGYAWLPELGGRRSPRPDSPNTAWRSTAFRGYADYMATEPFAEGLGRLADLGCGLRTAIMCAEAVWWRCHRALIADALRWAGFEVYHILGLTSSTPHPYTSAARITAGRLSYAGPG